MVKKIRCQKRTLWTSWCDKLVFQLFKNYMGMNRVTLHRVTNRYK